MNCFLWSTNEYVRATLPPTARPPRFVDILSTSAPGPPTAPLLTHEPTPLSFHIHTDNAADEASSATLSALLVELRAQPAGLANASLLVAVSDDAWREPAAFLETVAPRLRLTVGAVPGLDETLCDVAALSLALELCAARHGRAACALPAWLPPVVAMPAQAALWQQWAVAHPHWIVREPRRAVPRARPAAPRIVSGAHKGADSSPGGGGGGGGGFSHHLQPFVTSRPLLWRGRKHSLRRALNRPSHPLTARHTAGARRCDV
jgi:hypothetical protein